MESDPLIKLVIGLLCTLVGLGYLYRPDIIERLLAFLRETVLNDSHIALERRKWGVFFLLIGFLFLYMSFSAQP
ncbi:MAG: hypothetical protein NTY77_08210 [Elusimicrobia bacterium]|nr:hypothetical protein [Elusimicrobiota bacterium]